MNPTLAESTTAATRIRAFEDLLLEAASVARNWKSPVFREHASREAARFFLPGPEEIGRSKHLQARALRSVVRAMATASDKECEHLAAAARDLVASLRSEPVKLVSATELIDPSTDVRKFWVEK